jgi:hypothetical protein
MRLPIHLADYPCMTKLFCPPKKRSAYSKFLSPIRRLCLVQRRDRLNEFFRSTGYALMRPSRFGHF